MIFRDRDQAARLLGEKLRDYRGQRPLVLGIPRGAVPMARVIADVLKGELDVILVHKFTMQDYPEYALGAVTEEGDVYLGAGARVLQETRQRTEDEIAEVAALEVAKIRAKRALYSPKRGAIDPRGRIVIIVDDGIATGATMVAAVRAVREKGAARVVVATPVASAQAIQLIEKEGAEVVVLSVPEHFYAVSQFYQDFAQVEDQEVVRAMDGERPEVTIRVNDIRLKAFLVVPDRPRGLVLFAHGSGSGRMSPRNRFVARILQDAGFATCLADLLDEEESEDRQRVFDIDLLSRRLTAIMEWIQEDPQLRRIPLGLFGASTGAAAAIRAAVRSAARGTKSPRVQALVSRGGRPDLAPGDLPLLRVPILLIVGSEDGIVLELNRQAARQMTCENVLTVVTGASHLFEEPGRIEEVALLAQRWFEKHLPLKELSPGPRSRSPETGV